MIDLSAVCNSEKRKRFLIGIPFFLLVVLMLPLMLLLAPVLLVACLAVGVNPVDAGRGLWHVLAALRGTHVEVADRDRSVLFHVS
jgi:hypothetical protein